MFRSTTRSVPWGIALTLVAASCVLDRSPGQIDPGPGAGGEGAGIGADCVTSDQCDPSATLCQVPACVAQKCTYKPLAGGSECEDDGVCDGEGFCKATVGQSCDGDAACFEASCVDGFCCSSSCEDLCSSCAVAGSEGTCAAEPSGTVSGDCPDSVCDGLGACVTGELTWGATFGGSLASAAGFAIDPDGSGNSYLLTEVDGDVTFGSDLVSTVATTDVALVKLDPAGLPLWTFHLIPTLDAFAYDVKATSDGGAVGAGYFYGELATKVATLVAELDADGWVVRFGANEGESPAWAKRIGGNGHERVLTVAASPDGDDVLAGGLFNGTLDYGGGITANTAGSFDGYVVKLGPTGNVAWHREIGGTDSSGVAEVLFDGAETLAVGGFTGAITLDGPLNATDADVFVARLDESGAPVPQGSYGFGGAGNQDPTAAALMPDGGLVIVGYYDTGFTIGSETLPFTGDDPGQDDVFVVRLGPDGTHLWARSFNGARELRAWDVAVDAAGNVLVVGSFEDDATIAGEAHSSFNAGWADAYVAKLTPEGERLWVRTYGDLWVDGLYGVGIDAQGHAYATGSFETSVTLAAPHDAQGFVDVFALKLGP